MKTKALTPDQFRGTVASLRQAVFEDPSEPANHAALADFLEEHGTTTGHAELSRMHREASALLQNGYVHEGAVEGQEDTYGHVRELHPAHRASEVQQWADKTGGVSGGLDVEMPKSNPYGRGFSSPSYRVAPMFNDSPHGFGDWKPIPQYYYTAWGDHPEFGAVPVQRHVSLEQLRERIGLMRHEGDLDGMTDIYDSGGRRIHDSFVDPRDHQHLYGE